MESLHSLMQALGQRMDADLLRQAITHRSYAYEHGGLPTNERLEFLGDSVLGIVVTERLFRDFPDEPEGQLAKLRAAVVNASALAEVARELDLGLYVTQVYLGNKSQALLAVIARQLQSWLGLSS